ncbi:MAG: rRNA maturation RNase YbeY, partial [Collinsella sp.]|nr:rRNA maturation RNase YbeY [Collinsella sp.]
MAVLISNDAGLDTPLTEAEMEQVVRRALELEGVEAPVGVSVSIVDAEEMRGLNKMWRDIDKPTDVLSFECDSPFDEVPEGEEVELGDVILAPEVIAAQAPEFSSTPADEFRLMLVHGILHLLGFDHMDPDEAAEMEARELSILQELARMRGDDP